MRRGGVEVLAALLLVTLEAADGFGGGWGFVVTASPDTSSRPFLMGQNSRIPGGRPGFKDGLLSLQAREAPKLGDVVLPRCKTLCPGCEPWICPLAPENAEVKEISESSARLEELRREKLLEAERARMEAVAAGVTEVSSTEEFTTALNENSGRIVVVFWGGPWCRKCTVLKPKFVSLASRLSKEEDEYRFIYADAKLAKDAQSANEMVELGLRAVTTVPTFQVWKENQVLDQYTAGMKVEKVIPAVESMIAECEMREVP